MKIELTPGLEVPLGATLSYSETDALSRRISQVLRRVEKTFPANGMLAADLVLLRRILGSVDIDPTLLHGDIAGYREAIEKVLLDLLDRIDLVRSAFAVEPYRGKPAIEIEAVQTIKPNGNGAEQAHLNF